MKIRLADFVIDFLYKKNIKKIERRWSIISVHLNDYGVNQYYLKRHSYLIKCFGIFNEYLNSSSKPAYSIAW